MTEIIEAILRSSFAFVAVLVLARLVGKQQITEWTVYDFIAAITIGGLAALMAGAMTIDMWPIFASLVTFVSLTYIAGQLSLQSRPLRKLLQGEPTVVIHNGKVLEGNMRSIRYNREDLVSHLRARKIFDTSQVAFAILEPNGELLVKLKGNKLK